MKYTFRKSVFSKPTTLSIHDAKLVMEEEKGNTFYVGMDDILSLSVEFAPNKTQPNLFLATLRTRHHPKKLIISNTSYRGISNFEEHSEAFSAFIQTLALSITEHNPHAEISSGCSRARYLLHKLILWGMRVNLSIKHI